MANAKTSITKVQFEITPELTHCNVFYTSDEPGTPWGGGWKTKTFPKSKSVVDILQKDISDYLLWNDGKEEVDESFHPTEYVSNNEKN